MLPHLLRSAAYAKAYVPMCKDAHYVIMDNGAAEGTNEMDDVGLMIIGEHYKPQELVLPDVMGDTRGTLIASTSFLNKFREAYSPECRETMYNIGFVAQAKTIEGSYECAARMLSSTLGDFIDVIYIPRLLLAETKDVFARVKVARKLRDALIRNGTPEIDIHFLGASPLWASEVLYAATQVPFVRSIDTSLPYVYASYGLDLKDHGEYSPPPIRGANMNYFTDVSTEPYIELAKKNVETYLRWSRGRQ